MKERVGAVRDWSDAASNYFMDATVQCSTVGKSDKRINQGLEQRLPAVRTKFVSGYSRGEGNILKDANGEDDSTERFVAMPIL